MRKMTESDDLFQGNAPLDTAAAANFTGLAVATLAKLRCIGGGPAYLKLGRKVMYRGADLVDWLSMRRVNNTAEAAISVPRRLTDNSPTVKNNAHRSALQTSPDRHGMGIGFIVIAPVAYIDTVTLFHRGMFPRHELSWLRRRFARRMILKSCKAPGDAFCGGLITLHQPDVETLERLIAIPKRRFVVSAVHIAVDFICPDQGQAKLAAAFLGRAAVQKWHRRNHCSHREKNTHYFRQERSTRNIAIYGDRESKTGEGPCCHLEMRFTGAAACKRAGLDLNSLLDGPDVLRLLNGQARIAPIDSKRLDRAIERKARRWLRGTQRRHPKTACLPSQRRWPLSAFVVTDSAFLPYWGGGLVRAADDSNVRSRQAPCIASANSSPDQARAGAG
jgi:hypothetical protein